MEDKIENNKSKTLALLNCVTRPGIDEFKKYLLSTDFFVAPASTKWHGAAKGMLCKHSLNVTTKYMDFKKNNQNKIKLSAESCIICGLGHDLVKVDKYIGDSKPYSYASRGETGHALISIKILEQFITLTDEEKRVILYHMGVWGTKEFDPDKGEYSFTEYVKAINNNDIFFFHTADMIAARLMED